MPQIIREVSIDVARSNIFQAIIAKQHDTNSRFLKVTITDQGKKISVENSSIVTINGTRPDDESKAFKGSVNEDGTVTVPLTGWLLELDGRVQCDISIVDAEKRRLTTTKFTLLVEVAAYDGSDISEDEDEDLLVSILAECAGAKEAGEKNNKIAKKLFSNALKGTALGSIIALDDVSPVEHEVECVVRSENAIAYPYPANTNKDLVITTESDGTIVINGINTATTNFYLSRPAAPTFLKTGRTYTLSVSSNNSSLLGYVIVQKINTDGSFETEAQTYFTPRTFTALGEQHRVFCSLQVGNYENVTFKIKIEEGTVATPYVPYVDVAKANVSINGKNYVPTTEGKIENVKSTSPEMTFSTDTENVVIDVSYNRDINKAFSELLTELHGISVANTTLENTLNGTGGGA